MSAKDDLSSLLEAERAEQADAAGEQRGWSRLEGSLAAGATPLGVSVAPLSLGLSAGVKWGVGAGAVALVAGGVGLAGAPSEPVAQAPAQAPVASAVRLATPEAPKPLTPEKPVEIPQPTDSPLESNHGGQASTLTEEVQLMKAAKREIDAGRAHLAEVWLEEHARRYPRGVLRTEREALRILVACSGSDPLRGRRAAADFLRTNPRSPLVDRLSRACLLEPTPPADGKIGK
jgi:hypothetical protein